MENELLVVVDMQNDFIDGSLGTKEAESLISDMADYISNWGARIVFTRDTHGKDYLSTLEGKKLPVEHCIKDTDGWQIRKELTDAATGKDVTIIDKPTFGSLDLQEYVKNGGFDTIKFCGVCTGICVISNVLLAKAASHETNIQVIERLCACVTPESHKTAIEAMKTCQIDVI
ncbi:MAG: cysteine hydrolase [Lachnospiraceae bacterium]|nr:cysteine hydrolase [Lachnospiraceae bacterium]